MVESSPSIEEMPGWIRFPTGSSFGKMLARKGVGDDDYRRRAVSIILIKIAALQDRDAHRAEVPDARGKEVAGRFIFFRNRPSVNLKRDTESIATEWQRVY